MRVISYIQRLLIPNLHPDALLIEELLQEINFQHRAKILSELEQSHKWQKRLKAKIYKNLKKVNHSSFVFIATSSCTTVLIYYLENKVWILISCLALFVSVLIYFIFYPLLLRWVLQEFDMNWQERWKQVARCSLRRMDGKETNIANAMQRIEAAIRCHKLQGNKVKSLINFLLGAVVAFITTDLDFLRALLRFPFTGSFADVWNASSEGTLFLLLLVLISIYYFWSLGVHIIRLEQIWIQLNLGFYRTK